VVSAELRDRRSLGVHLHVPRANRRAAEFYRHFGFTELPAAEAELPAPYLHLFGIDVRQPTPNRP
jgi:ribosomal protein S18 acetylase RimI-like enzyme